MDVKSGDIVVLKAVPELNVSEEVVELIDVKEDVILGLSLTQRRDDSDGLVEFTPEQIKELY